MSIFKAETDQEAKESQNKLSLLSFAGLPSHLWAGFNKSKSYLYQFTKVPPIKPNFPDYGAFHTSEVPYALHTLHTWQRDWQANDKALENIMSDYWVNFAKTGNPNGSGLPVWNAYDKAEGIMMVLGDKVEQQKALLKKELDYLEKNQ